MPESGTKVQQKRADVSPKAAQSRAASLQEEKARIAEVLGRGLVSDMIEIKDGDPSRRYAWIRERDLDIKKFEALGYRIETDAGEGAHGTGDNRRRVGDVILMSCSRDRYDLIEEVRREQRRKRIDSPIKEYKARAAAAAARDQAAPPLDLLEE
jgi:hypothetical protein